MASNNSTLSDPDEEGEFPDWIEIYNTAPFAVSLGGMYLTDDLSEPTKYRIPDEVTVPAHGYVVFMADGEDTQDALAFHTNFRLSSGGESIGLMVFDQAGADAFTAKLEEMMDQSNALKLWYLSAIDQLASEELAGICPIDGLSWCEVDDATDFAAAANVVKQWST